MNTVEFLDVIKQRHNFTSDYQLWKSGLLGVGQQTISNYRKGKTFFDDTVAIKAAALLDLPEGYVISCVHAERERPKRPDVARAWERMARTIKSAAATIMLAFALTLTPIASQDAQASKSANNIHYTNQRRWWWRWAARRALRATLSAIRSTLAGTGEQDRRRACQ